MARSKITDVMSTNQSRHKTALFMQACVFPGAGYFLIGKKVRGALFVVATCYFLIMPLVRFTRTLFALIMPANARHAVGTQLLKALPLAWGAHKPLILWSLAGIVILWIFGIVDVWYQMKRSVDYGVHDH